MIVLENIWHSPVRVKGVKKSEALAEAHRLLGMVGLSEKAAVNRAVSRVVNSSGSPSLARWRCSLP